LRKVTFEGGDAAVGEVNHKLDTKREEEVEEVDVELKEKV
jgi:hypothetical protein